MKRHSNREKVLIQPQAEVDVAGLINKIQEHLISLERKIDTLISRPYTPANERHFEHSYRNDRGRQSGGFSERKFYKVICTDCGKECEVPFKPGQDRPVYCKECFSKRRNSGNLFKPKHDNMPIESNENRKFGKKKKPFSRRLKKR